MFLKILESKGMRSGISWTAENITYGLVLAEENVVSRQETILMSYSSIACMDLLGYISSLPRRTLSEMARSEEECARIIKCVKLVAGHDTSDWVHHP